MDSAPQAWRSSASPWYHSDIRIRPASVTVYSAAADEEVSNTRPGTPVLYLEPRRGRTGVFDTQGREQGVVRAEGFFPGLQFAMRKDGAAVWTLRIQSLV